MTIPFDQAYHIALSDACEDYTGMYEFIWGLNSQFPEVSEAEKITVGQAVFERLHASGFIQLYHTKWMSDDYVPVPKSEVLEIISDPKSWRSPADTPDESYYCFTSTEAGDRAYFTADPTSKPADG